MRVHRKASVAAAVGLMGGLLAAQAAGATSSSHRTADRSPAAAASTATPIKHLVVIFDENISFDHYFGTYPYAKNPRGEPAFDAAPGTPTVNGLSNSVGPSGPTGPLLTHNPNGSNPVRIGRDDPMTCDQDHDYTAEQLAADHGAEDAYPANTGGNLSLAQCLSGFDYLGKPEHVPAGASHNKAVMDYYDGNTVTGLWNYAQHYAMNDNMYGTTYGPSTPGALNVTSAQTYGVVCGPNYASIKDPACSKGPRGLNKADPAKSHIVAGKAVAAGPGTTYSDADPYFDICSYVPAADGGDADTVSSTMELGGRNIGDSLTAAKLTWGWFEGGFDDGYVPKKGTTPPTTAQICSEEHEDVGGSEQIDYSPHHEPFEYYASTANPMHVPPSSVAMIGKTDQANHQYDIADFWAAANAGNLPAVSYLKAPRYQDGHAGYSDPLDEQTWLADTINHLESLSTWKSTAVVLTWDDSDGWYDHVLGPLVTQSQVSAIDALTGTGVCGTDASQVPKSSTGKAEEGKCGVGPRLPFLVISPWARVNFVDNTFIDQSSVVKFIEYNWHLSSLGNGAADAAAGSLTAMFNFSAPKAPEVFINPKSGEVVKQMKVDGRVVRTGTLVH